MSTGRHLCLERKKGKRGERRRQDSIGHGCPRSKLRATPIPTDDPRLTANDQRPTTNEVDGVVHRAALKPQKWRSRPSGTSNWASSPRVRFLLVQLHHGHSLPDTHETSDIDWPSPHPRGRRGSPPGRNPPIRPSRVRHDVLGVPRARTAYQERRHGGDGDREPLRRRRRRGLDGRRCSSPDGSVLRRGSRTRRLAGRDDRAAGAEPAGRLFPVGLVRECGACGSALAASRHQPLRLDHRQGARCGPVRSRGGDARRELGLALQHGGVRDAAAPNPGVDSASPLRARRRSRRPPRGRLAAT